MLLNNLVTPKRLFYEILLLFVKSKTNFKLKYPIRSRSSSPVVKGETKPDLVKIDDKQLDPGEIVVLDSDDEESRNARARMEARMRAQIEHRRLEEFESIIRGKNKKSEPKKRRKRPIKDPTPIVLSD